MDVTVISAYLHVLDARRPATQRRIDLVGASPFVHAEVLTLRCVARCGERLQLFAVVVILRNHNGIAYGRAARADDPHDQSGGAIRLAVGASTRVHSRAESAKWRLSMRQILIRCEHLIAESLCDRAPEQIARSGTPAQG